MTDAPELLPCPFCGGEADISHDHTVEENHAYGCRKCDVWFDSFNSDNAIAAWNTRADLAAAQVAEAVAEARRKAFREGWLFAFKQCEATGSVPDPDHNKDGKG